MEDLAWRIDTLDARGGIAFASWRGETLMEEPSIEDAPVFFIGAPNFTPVPIASRAIALAAERHGFQLGLFDRDGEVAFETIGDVAEYVRRLYIASGLNDGPGSGAPPTVPIRPPEPPLSPGGEPQPPPTLEREDSAAHDDIAGMTKLFEFAATFFSKDNDFRERWPTRDLEEAAMTADAKASRDGPLVRGAVVLLAELIQRFPPLHDHIAQDRWRRSAERFVATLVRLDLVPWLTSSPAVDQIAHLCRWFIRVARNDPAITFSPAEAVAMSLRTMLLPGRSSRGLGEGLLVLAAARSTEPLDDLAAFPIPVDLAKAIDAPHPDVATLANLLAAILASPQRLLRHPDLEAVAIFAAARIVAYDGAPFTRPMSTSFAGPVVEEPGAAARQGVLVARALAWLAANLPKRAFREELEAMIRGEAAYATA